jgi:hypothetical protein
MPGSKDEAAGLLDAYVEAKRQAAEEHVCGAVPGSE